MAKLDGNKRLSREDMPNSQDWIDPFLTNQNQVNDSLVNAVRGSLTMQDNTTSGYFTGKFTHGVERIIRNPLIKSGTKGPSPTGVQAVNCQKLYTDAASLAAPVVASVALRYLNGNDPTAPEQVGITVQYAPPPGVGNTLEVATTANTGLIGTGVNSTISWSGIVTQNQIGTSITWLAGNPTQVSIATAGLYLLRGTVSWDNASAVGNRTAYIYTNGNVVTKAEISAAPTFFTQIETTKITRLAANSTVELHGIQTSGGNLVMRGGGSLSSDILSADRCFLSVTRLCDPDPATTANVTLFFHGG